MLRKCRLLLIVSILSFCSVKAQFREIYNGGDPNNFVTGMSFISASTGYVSTLKYIGYTQDSGRTLLRKYITFSNVDFNGYSPNLTFGFYPSGVHAFHQDTLLIYGNYGFAPSILYSTNGGNSWKLVYFQDLRPGASELNQGITDMKFQRNGNIGYAIHHDQVLKSTDRGKNWTVSGNFIEQKLKSISSAEFTFLYVVGENQVFKSINAGATWGTLIVNANGFAAPQEVFFLSSAKGFLRANKLFYTPDGGASWVEKGGQYIQKMYFINDTIGYALGGAFTVYKTFDGGNIWELLPRDNNFEAPIHNYFENLYVFNDSTLWAGGGSEHLEISTNGGGIPIPFANFHIDVSLLPNMNLVQLKNDSRRVYQYQWFKNGQFLSSNYDTYYNTPRLSVDTIMLVVSNGISSDTNVQIFDTRPPHDPSAAFTFVRDTSTVKFFASDTYSTVRHYWDFGDGIRDSVSVNPIHQYDNIGTFNVKHVAITPIDGRKDSVTQQITITTLYNCIPLDFGFDIDPFFVNKYKFTPIGTYPTYTWIDWDWGDGTAHLGSYVGTHSFDSAKTYSVCLKMRNNTGCTTTVCKDVTVTFRSDCYPDIRMIGGLPGNPCNFDFFTPPFAGRKRHTWILDGRDTIITGSSGYLHKNYAEKGPPEYYWFDEPYQTYRYTFHPDSIHRKLKHIVYDSATGCETSFDTSFTLKYKIDGIKMYAVKHPTVPNYVTVFAVDSIFNRPIYPRMWGISHGQYFGPNSNYLPNAVSWNFRSTGTVRFALVPEYPHLTGNIQEIYEIFVNIDTVVACAYEPNFTFIKDPLDSSRVTFTNTTNIFGDYETYFASKFYFGDGDSSITNNIHPYQTSGVFNACIRVTTDQCDKVVCKEVVINNPTELILCPYRNFSLVAKVLGDSYQWQVNTGSGYVNIADNALHQGTNNDTLNFIAPPSSMYGYKYRCVVTKAGQTLYNHEFVLKFQVDWTGNLSQAWEHGSNWACWVTPDENTDVVVEGSGVNPVINSNVTIRSLTVKPGASVTVNSGYTLTILKK